MLYVTFSPVPADDGYVETSSKTGGDNSTQYNGHQC